jgi:deoxyribodipyrimidine photo-lyase
MSSSVNDVSSSDDDKTTTMRRLALHWFRTSDLRLHDNPALCRSAELSLLGARGGKEGTTTTTTTTTSDGGALLPVFVFDTSRVFGSEILASSSSPGGSWGYGSRKCGPRRAKFVLEAVADLRSSLERRGSGLIVAIGKPEDALAYIAGRAAEGDDEYEYDDDDGSSGGQGVLRQIDVVCQEEVCSEELSVDKAVRAELARTMMGGKCKFKFEAVWGSTMYDPDDMPFDGNVRGVPDTFTPFRNRVEKECSIGTPYDEPDVAGLKLPANVRTYVDGKGACRASLDYMPTLSDLGYASEDIESASIVDARTAMPANYRGGETYALARVKEYIWDKDLLKAYFDTRNGMIGSDYSTKFAPWLAHGNVSPRHIARECRRYEEARVKNKSTYWVVFELLWRDYFKFFAKKHGDNIFRLGGTAASVASRKWGMDPKKIRAWKDGMTGYPLVDANMRELAATGFMSNRGRQNVCSFLAIDMNMDWRHGAAHFEEHLLDYDVHSNWGNWCSGAGMTGGRLNRFNIVKQSKDYDFGGEYVRLWCPELANVPDKYVHEPWKMSEALMEECGVKIGPGRDYPSPIVDPSVTPKIMDDGRGGGRGHGRGGKQRGRGDNGGRNPNRGQGQRQDMKSLKTGSYSFDSKYV